MSQIYLHHYPESPFSEKIRAILGFLSLEWNSVTISMIMPRPKLMPLSGGYRKTPILQIGANVYCDTKVIARALADHAEDGQLFAGGFAAHRIADWADTHLFRVCVGLLFRPEALGPMMAKGGFGNVDMGAFMKDRAELVGNQPLATFSGPAAESFVLHYLSELESSVVNSGFLLGSRPTIADFSVYHCLWFLRNSPYNAPLVESRTRVMEWVERMAAFGHGKRVDSTADAALAAARASEPVAPKPVVLALKAELGQTVQVAPIDYGRVPVSGELVCADAEQFALRRHSDETGDVITHFPRPGFEIVG
jgi:glutathione S-transferase